MKDSDYKIKNGHLIITDGVISIGDYAFSENNITSLTIPNSVTSIGECAFSINNITSLTIPNSVTSIGECAFSENNITSLIIPDSITLIEDFAFSQNKITSLVIPNSVTLIGNDAFSANNITSLTIPNSVTLIGDYAFIKNKINSLIIPDSVTLIGKYAFSKNSITNVTIPDSVTSIGKCAFSENNITSLTIPDSVTSIGDYAFNKNNITSITIPDSVTSIGKCVFDNNIEILHKGNIYKYEDVSFENGIIIVSEILDIVPSYDYKNINPNITANIPIDNDSIKGFVNNKKIFENLVQDVSNNLNINITNKEYADFFKLCYILGLFHTGGEKQQKIINDIKNIMEEYGVDKIHQLFTKITIDKYNSKISKFFLENYKNEKFYDIFARFYNEYENISKVIIKLKEEEIRKFNIERIKTEKMELSDNKIIDILDKLEELKKNKENITLQDVIEYVSQHIFTIREGNEELETIVQTLSSYVNSEEFDIIQDIYEESLKIKDNKIFSSIKGDEKDGYSYYWSPGENPNNFILGYLCDCCARYGDTGKEIMRQSIVNPYIKNLIIYDSYKNIVGKSTAYYNQKEKYILFNNIEMGQRFKSTANNQNKKLALDTILRGIRDQVKVMREQGYDIEEVRMGLLGNDLLDEIEERKDISVTKTDLKDNYAYGSYRGDANNPKFGQAIIPIEKKIKHKSR